MSPVFKNKTLLTRLGKLNFSGPQVREVREGGFYPSALERGCRSEHPNGLERLNNEIKRRPRVACLFPNPERCLRLVSALLCEQDEQWQSAKIYLSMNVAFVTKNNR